MKKLQKTFLVVLVLMFVVAALFACQPIDEPSDPKTKYTVTFDLDGGTGADITAQQVEEGTKLSLAKFVPTKDGYTFEGWTIDDEVVTEITVSSDVTLKAVWSQSFVLSIEAFSVNCGYILAPMSIQIQQGKSLAQIVCDVITQQGWTYANYGTVEDGFYLSEIKGLSLQGNLIDSTVREHIAADTESGNTLIADSIEADENGKYTLGGSAFTTYAGWMYSVNGTIPDYAMSAYSPKNGDVVRLQFSVCMGGDLDNGEKSSYPATNYVTNKPDYSKVLPLTADIAAKKCFGKSDELLKKVLAEVSKWNVEQKTIDDGITQLKNYYYGA